MTTTSHPTVGPATPGPATPGPATPGPAPRPRRARRRALLLGLLLALTAAGAVAARGLGRGHPDPLLFPVPPADPLAFVAPGAGPVHLSGRLDRGGVLRGGDGLVRMELTLRADAPTGLAPRVPTDLVVVLDRSGSMSGPPLAFAKAAVRELLAQLGPDDRFALVSYASDARVDLPLAPVAGEARPAVEAAVEAIQALGGTNMAAGLDLATGPSVLRRGSGRTPRVMLISDGHANEGDASAAGLAARARRALAGEWVLSAVGVGEGFDEALMSNLADAGTGNFYYLRDARALGEVFHDEFASARETVASALAVHLRPGPGVRVADAAGYPLERSSGEVVFHPGSLFAGQERRVWVSFRVPTSGDAGPGPFSLGRVALAYTRGDARHDLTLASDPQVELVDAEADFVASVNRDAWEKGVVGDELGRLKAEVGQAVQRGERRQALERIEGYVARNRALGRALGSTAVEEKLGEVRALEASVTRAFEPTPAAPALQNELSKKLQSEGKDARRAGAKR